MRTIKQFSETLAALLVGARSTGEAVSYKDLEELSLLFAGLSLDTLVSTNSSQLLSLFSITGELDVNKTYASARLIHQLSEQESSEQQAGILKLKALELLTEIKNQQGEYINEEHQTLTESLESTIKLSL